MPKTKTPKKTKRPARAAKPLDTARGKPAAPKAATSKAGPAKIFEEAIGLASSGYLFDAIKRFDQSAKADAKGELADDAIYNAGVCYFQLGLIEDAASYFSRIIQGYPNAKIHATAGAPEFGRTAAKAHLGRLRCHLVLGRKADAQKELEDLNRYPDSYVLDPGGQKKTYYELGLASLEGK